MVAEALSDTKRPSKLKQPRHALTSDFDRLTAGLPEGRLVNAESLSDSTSEGINCPQLLHEAESVVVRPFLSDPRLLDVADRGSYNLHDRAASY
jgi:hypothetical protein